MKLKYYLRGMGIGIILTAIVMGFALGGRKVTISEAEVIERAQALGMIIPESGVLLQSTDIGVEKDDTTEVASDTSLDEAGKEISQEIDETVSSSSESVSQLDEEKEKTEVKNEKDFATSDKVIDTDPEEKIVETVEAKPEASVAGAKKTETSNDNSTALTSAVINETDNAKTVNAAETTEKVETKDTSADAKNTEKVSSENVVTANTESSEANTSAKVEEDTTSSSVYISTKSVTVTIPGGTSSDRVANILYNEGVIDNAVLFNKYLVDTKMDRVIRSGVKNIPAGSTYADIAAILCRK